ncbi:MAG: hypothetical protein ABIJ46_02945 [bacterium]
MGEGGRNIEQRLELHPKSFQEQLKEFVAVSGIEFQQVKEQDERQMLLECRKRDEYVVRAELASLLSEYGSNEEVVDSLSLVFDSDVGRKEKREGLSAILTLPVRNHFSERRLPEGYAYKGGAARALLERTLELDSKSEPRDLDVVRLTWMLPDGDDDVEVAKDFMPEDFAGGAGVEPVNDLNTYFDTRDLTMNQALATDDAIFMTKGCLLDTVRRIIRPTEYELDFGESRDGRFTLGSKMMAKVIRLYADAISRFGFGEVAGLGDWYLEPSFISPFWLANNLDRAVQNGEDEALSLVNQLVELKYLPSGVSTVEEAAGYILKIMRGRSFHFRYAPVGQYKLEDQGATRLDLDRKNQVGIVADDDFDDLPFQQSHRRSKS